MAVAVGGLLIGSQAAFAGSQHQATARELRSAAPRTQAVIAMTYDIRDLRADGTFEGSGHIAPWKKRVRKQAAIINQIRPDVIAVQEGSTYLPHSHQRQIDSFRKAVGGTYRIARTEIPPNQPHHFRTGNYIVYNKLSLESVGKGGHFSIGNQKWAAYHVFASRISGAKFLFVSTHLIVGLGSTYDGIRAAETHKMLSRTHRIAKRHHVPVIYGGDFNSSSTHAGSGKVLHQAGMRDALTIAADKVAAKYDSDNEYLRTPPHRGIDIDHLYVSSGLAVPLAGINLELRHGKFVGPIPSDHNPVSAIVDFP
jgi:endonuclease/exonuclease/phosphatase family metal-dependent hydrolase